MTGVEEFVPDVASSPVEVAPETVASEETVDPTVQTGTWMSSAVAAKVARKREEEAKRRERILNAKVRTIGIDKEGLGRSVAEKVAVDAAKKADDVAFDRGTLEVSYQLKLIELERQRQHHVAELDNQTFNAVNLKKEFRREYDLSDPDALKKELPTRLGDVDERLGVSSCQVFMGEDIHKKERVKAQQQQQREWILQQLYAKKEVEEAETEFAAEVAAQSDQTVALRAELEKQEAELRRVITQNQLEHNAEVRQKAWDEKIENKHLRSKDERIRDYLENKHAESDQLLNESAPQFLDSGRINRAEFRGYGRNVYKQVAEVQEYQKAEVKGIAQAEKDFNMSMDNMAEDTRRTLVAMEREKDRHHTAVTVEALSQNDTSIGAKGRNKRDLSIEESFFQQFGKAGR